MQEIFSEIGYRGNFKVRVDPEESKLIQKYFFKQGGRWADTREQKVRNVEFSYLVVSGRELSALINNRDFVKINKREVVLTDPDTQDREQMLCPHCGSRLDHLYNTELLGGMHLCSVCSNYFQLEVVRTVLYTTTKLNSTGKRVVGEDLG